MYDQLCNKKGRVSSLWAHTRLHWSMAGWKRNLERSAKGKEITVDYNYIIIFYPYPWGDLVDKSKKRTPPKLILKNSRHCWKHNWYIHRCVKGNVSMQSVIRGEEKRHKYTTKPSMNKKINATSKEGGSSRLFWITTHWEAKSQTNVGGKIERTTLMLFTMKTRHLVCPLAFIYVQWYS